MIKSLHKVIASHLQYEFHWAVRNTYSYIHSFT